MQEHDNDEWVKSYGRNIGRILGTIREGGGTIVPLAAWADLLSAGGEVSDGRIVHEVLNNWHESKQRIPEDRWMKALGWMRENGFVPKGAA